MDLSAVVAGEPMCWYAMSAPYNRELKVKNMLDNENIECFVPMRYEIRNIKGKKERVYVPAVSNLIFVYTTESRLKLFKQKINYLQYLTLTIDGNSKKITVPDERMRQFIHICNTYDKKLVYLRPEEVNLSKGVKVRIHGGAFNDVEGIFVKIKGIRNRRVVVLIQGVAAVATAEIHPDLIEVME